MAVPSVGAWAADAAFQALTIGDFSRATSLSIKTLRLYHSIGLLVPADVDPGTGYRRYTADQVSTAQVIRRFRSLDMPLEKISAVISAPGLDTRIDLAAGHLGRLEDNLARGQGAAASLRDLLQPRSATAPVLPPPSRSRAAGCRRSGRSGTRHG